VNGRRQGGHRRTVTRAYSITAVSGTDATGKDFGNFKNITISGKKYNDLNGNGTFRYG